VIFCVRGVSVFFLYPYPDENLKCFLADGFAHFYDFLGDFHFSEVAFLSDGEVRFERNSIYLGGSHKITFSIVDGLLKNNIFEGFDYLVFDAHLDFLNKELDRDSVNFWVAKHFGHRIRNFFIVGARDYALEELDNARKCGVKVLNFSEFGKKFARKFEGYVSLDIDVLDYFYCPNTYEPTPGGIDPYSLLDVLELLNVRAMDVVEVGGRLDAKIGAYIVREFIRRKSTTSVN